MRNLVTENPNRPHAGKIAAQAFVMLLRCRDPDAVVWVCSELVAQYQNNFLSYVDRQASDMGRVRT